MPTARDVMTSSISACSPDTSVAQVAKMMRDRNIGDILILQEGDLLGIVTDRDLAIKALAEEDDVRDEPIKKYMSKNPVTGKVDWSLDRLADTMGKNQIRRLPIMEKDKVVGVVSLGDLALRDYKKPAIAESLKEISEPTETHMAKRAGSGIVRGLALGLVAGAAFVLLMTPRSGQEFRQMIQETDFQSMMEDLLDQARGKLDQVSGVLAGIQPSFMQPIKPKRKRFWIV